MVIDIVPFQNCVVTRRTRRIPALRLPARLASRCRTSLYTARHSVRFVMNCSSSLSSLVCIVSVGFACAVNAQTLPAVPADAPALASSAVLPPAPLQRSAQAAATNDAADPAATASGVATPAFARPAASAAVQPDTRARGMLRRPLVPGRPHRSHVAVAPADDVWRSDRLYESPYAKSPYEQPGVPD
ncbi:hypothetical protein [Burkholderia sp. MSMB0856]|uniref:hypothetical protein n=1 Tax=Burkholderia sp. MSMB0856 TaxID=1637869 RepID=UPI001F48BCF6|nr:hypothetical protein [Burkholderia sp. MSMB0856]